MKKKITKKIYKKKIFFTKKNYDNIFVKKYIFTKKYFAKSHSLRK